MQKILTITTLDSDLRATSEAWGWENGDFVDIDKPIGLSGSGKAPPAYDCPLKAIGDGWKLLAPPVKDYWKVPLGNEPPTVIYEWWFTKD